MKQYSEEEIKRNRERYKKQLQGSLKIPKEGEIRAVKTVDIDGVVHWGVSDKYITKNK